ncbi:MAG: hypothetical protein GKR94_01055 [Gammaproteobacteria bacterium]|nr:hypothetical protein [Gammaproteobacteria bacterium]
MSTENFTFNQVLIRRDLVASAGGFDPAVRACEEANLAIRMISRNAPVKVAVQTDPLLVKRVGYYSLGYTARSQREIPWLLISFARAARDILKDTPHPALHRSLAPKLYQAPKLLSGDGLCLPRGLAGRSLERVCRLAGFRCGARALIALVSRVVA